MGVVFSLADFMRHSFLCIMNIKPQHSLNMCSVGRRFFYCGITRPQPLITPCVTAVCLPICQLWLVHILSAICEFTLRLQQLCFKWYSEMTISCSYVSSPRKTCFGSVVLCRFCSHPSPHCLTFIWLKSPADSGDIRLQRRHLECHGRQRSRFRPQYKSPTPKTSAILGHWPTNKRLSQIHFAPCLSALCVSFPWYLH